MVRTGSGARAVQVIWRYVDNRPVLDHVGSAHSDADLELLRLEAQALIDDRQPPLPLDFGGAPEGVAHVGSVADPLPVCGERAGVLLEVLEAMFDHLGLAAVCEEDRVFKNLVLARLIHPASTLDSIETLAEVGVNSASYPTIKRYLPRYATSSFHSALTGALATSAGAGPGMVVLYDVTTLYFETDTPDDFRISGFSKERRLEPQITVGLLTGEDGFPLAVGAFEGNMAETKTMLPMIRTFQERFNVDDVTVVADAGMFSTANKHALRQAGLHYVISTKFKTLPEPIRVWKDQHREADYEDGQIWSTQTPSSNCSLLPESVTYYQYSWDRARRTLRGIDEQLSKAQRAVAGKTAIKRNRYVQLTGGSRTVNHALAQKNRELAGIKGYETSRTDWDAQQVISTYRHLLRVEKSFRMSKSDLKARPIFHHKKESIHAHLAIVTAALAIAHRLEQISGLSIKRLIRTLKRYRTYTINIGEHNIQAAIPIPQETTELINKIRQHTQHKKPD